MATHNQSFGQRGEDAAAAWYRHAGYQLLDRNWRCRQGEIDIIAARDSTVIFVEVKARSSDRYGSGFEAVDWRKQQRIRQLAQIWLRDRAQRTRDCGESDVRFFTDLQFDVVDVDAAGTLQVRQQCF